MPNQQTYGIKLTSIDRPMNSVQPGANSARGGDSPVQQVFSNFGAAIEAGTGKHLSEFLVMSEKTPLLDPLDNLGPRTTFALEQRIEARKIAPSEALHCVVQRCVILRNVHGNSVKSSEKAANWRIERDNLWRREWDSTYPDFCKSLILKEDSLKHA
jgi:hypothetical protein